MKISTLLFVPVLSLSALANFPVANEAAPLTSQRLPAQRLIAQRLPQSMQRTEIQSGQSRTRPTHSPTQGSTTNTILQAPTDGGTAITCVNGTCYCNGNDDCDALFTSTKCVPGTETTSPDDESGQCTQND